jgi:hypothetical protein
MGAAGGGIRKKENKGGNEMNTKKCSVCRFSSAELLRNFKTTMPRRGHFEYWCKKINMRSRGVEKEQCEYEPIKEETER